MDEALYEQLRPRAFAIAYRMLGSVGEAEDVVQEGMLRLHRARDAGEPIESPAAWLATVVTRLSIDELRSARARRETYVGEWLPEPIVTDPADDPAAEAELADSLSLAFLTLLESLTPEQRAAFLLREVFDYPYDQIAAIVGRSEDASRQLASRARRRIDERRPRVQGSREHGEELARQFLGAVRDGDLESLERLLAADVELHGDGGGKVPALARAVHGRARVARTLVAWSRAAARFGGVAIELTEINGGPGAVSRAPDGGVVNVIALELEGGSVRSINSIVNPDKLRHLGPVADLGDLLAGGPSG